MAAKHRPGLAAVELNLVGDAEDEDYFGLAMATGDFDCDGDEDLVVGVPGEDGWNGAINVVYSGADAGVDELVVAGNLAQVPIIGRARGYREVRLRLGGGQFRWRRL